MSSFENMTEQRDFTNPHVRFVRIRGRIVPIYNKKRIGQSISSTGEKVAAGGVVATGAAIGLKAFGLDKQLSKLGGKILALKGLKSASGTGFGIRTMKAGFRFGGHGARMMMKHPLKTGLGLLLGGIGLKAFGDSQQMDSRFGKDYVLIKDQNDMGS